jgi:hypothetical protein
MSQLALPLAWPADAPDDGFLVGPSNARAVEQLDRWTTWPVPVAVLAGPPRSGRSLLARVFEQRTGGRAIDDAERTREVELFHAWNAAKDGGAPLLLVAAPGWNVALPDLRSRLAASVALEIGPPDDRLIRALLGRQFDRRGLDARDDLLDWLAVRIERSHAAVEHVAEALDRATMERRRRPSIPFARATLLDAGLLSRPTQAEDA